MLKVLLQKQEREFTFAEEARGTGLRAIPFLAHTLHGHGLRAEPGGSGGGAACLQPQKGTRRTDVTPSPGLLPPHPIVYQTKCFFSL